VASRLPVGAADTLRPGSQSVAPEVFAANQQKAFPIGAFMTGEDTVRVNVRFVMR
jgi:hypothetical protein